MLGTHVVLPCQADSTFAAYPRTRRALFGRHAAADDLRRIISSLAGCVRSPGANSISSFCSNILSDILNCTVPPLRVESSLLKHPIEFLQNHGPLQVYCEPSLCTTWVLAFCKRGVGKGRFSHHTGLGSP